MIEILAIDDDAAILSLIRRALERDGYRVTTVTDARAPWRQPSFAITS